MMLRMKLEVLAFCSDMAAAGRMIKRGILPPSPGVFCGLGYTSAVRILLFCA
jgi:hypothetical protein